jgi:tetratricopeptide (TPR) repeat protein
MAHRLIGLFNIRHPREGFAWYQQVLAVSGDLPARSRARLLGDTAYAAMNAGDPDGDVSFARDAIELGGDDAPAIAHYLLGLHDLCSTPPDYAAAVGHCRRAIATAAATGDVTTHALGVAELLQAVAFLGDAHEARQLIPEAIERAERLGNPTILAAAYVNAAIALARIGAPKEAVVMFERGLVHGDAGGPNVASNYRVLYALGVDDPYAAARIIQAAIPIAREHLVGYHQSRLLLGAAKIAVDCGSERTAARLLGALRHHGGWPTSAYEYWQHERLVKLLTDRLGAAIFEDELCVGAQLSIGQALQFAEDIVSATPTESSR